MSLLSGMGAGLQAGGQIGAGISAMGTGAWNAAMAKIEAMHIIEAGRREEAVFRRRAKAFMGTQRTRYAKAGVYAEGSPTDVMAETAGELERDALAIRYGARRRAYAKRLEAKGYEMTAKQRLATGIVEGTTSLIKWAGSQF